MRNNFEKSEKSLPSDREPVGLAVAPILHDRVHLAIRCVVGKRLRHIRLQLVDQLPLYAVPSRASRSVVEKQRLLIISSFPREPAWYFRVEL